MRSERSAGSRARARRDRAACIEQTKLLLVVRAAAAAAAAAAADLAQLQHQ